MKIVWIILNLLGVISTGQPSYTTQQNMEQEPWCLEIIGLYMLKGILIYVVAVLSLLIIAYVVPLKDKYRKKLLKVLPPLIPFFTPIMKSLAPNQRVWFETKIQIKQQDEPYMNNENDLWKQRLLSVQTDMVGLENLGNTCYFNSALQVLHKTFQLHHLLQNQQKESKSKSAFLDLFAEMSKNERQSTKPLEIKKLISKFNPVFSGFNQNDASQALMTLLRMLHVQLNQVEKIQIHKIDMSLRRSHSHSEQLWKQSKIKDHMRQKSIIDDIIYGRFKTTNTCQECGQVYILFEKFHAIYVPMPANKQKLTLKDCFDQFVRPQLFTGQNAMSCLRCQEDRPTSKTIQPYQTNQILIVCLKRQINGHKDKRKVDIPFEIEQTYINSVKEHCLYQLYAIISHLGSSLHSGHYTAICYDSTNKWVHYNDSYCHKISKEEVRQYARNSLVYLYRKK